MAANRDVNEAFDEIILNRRSIRSFKPDDLPKEYVEQVLKAGFAAPYAGATGFPLDEIRKFFVIKNGSAAHSRVEKMIVPNIKKNLKKLKFASVLSGAFAKKAKAFVERLKMMAEKGMPTLKTAPYYIIIAERKGFPPVEKQSMSYALENMWLKAAALGIGFQLISATGTMSKDREFMDMLGLKVGEYEIDGCVIGYAAQVPEKRIETGTEKYVKWLE
jgi:nitroreductase